MPFGKVDHMHLSVIKENNCTSNSKVITQDKAQCNFDCYEYTCSLIALKHMQLPTNHRAVPITLSLPLGSPCVPIEACLLTHIVIACS